MKTLICRTCGCSLVRLGISNDKAATYSYEGEEHHFCCQACADLFATEPQQYLEKTTDVVVCPTCLGEKPLRVAVTSEHAGQDVHFCGCPHCTDVFQKDPDYYIRRLEGTVPHEGVRGHDGCSVRPE